MGQVLNGNSKSIKFLDMKKSEPSETSGRSVKWYKPTVENSPAVSQKVKQSYPIIEQLYF